VLQAAANANLAFCRLQPKEKLSAAYAQLQSAAYLPRSQWHAEVDATEPKHHLLKFKSQMLMYIWDHFSA